MGGNNPVPVGVNGLLRAGCDTTGRERYCTAMNISLVTGNGSSRQVLLQLTWYRLNYGTSLYLGAVSAAHLVQLIQLAFRHIDDLGQATKVNHLINLFKYHS
jgi:hypothetical protein